jgi:hypothetical protein
MITQKVKAFVRPGEVVRCHHRRVGTPSFFGQSFAVEFDPTQEGRTHIDYAWDLASAQSMARVRCSLAKDGQARVHTTTQEGQLGEPVGFYAEVGLYPTWYTVSASDPLMSDLA